ncbi:GNAT family N-acetyltransferase [Fulvimarina sp. MAC8]|uniref:GNAT family N-acetyltransferase n=1 Tax=Fulvimarina sp. MAC8 TaxID=3162874 RepID=UPI0032EB867A
MSTKTSVKAADRLDAEQIYVRLESSLDFTSEDYAGLFSASNATAFQHPVWLTEFYGKLAAARGASPIIVTGRDAGGRLLFMLPMILRRIRGFRLLEANDLGVSDYCAPVIRTDARGTLIAQANLRSAIAAALPAHDLLRIRNCRAATADDWQLFFAEPFRDHDFSAHAAELGRDYESWRSTALPDSFRKQLDRKKRRFFKAGEVSIEQLTDPTAIREAITAFASLRNGRFAGDMIQWPAVEEFYADIAVAGCASGFARTYKMSFDGEPVAYLFGLCHAGRFNYLLIGGDYDRFGRHSPGLVFYDELIREWIAEGGSVFDFTIGDEAFKADFGTKPTRMVTLETPGSSFGRLALAARAARQRVRGWKNKKN